LKAKNLKCLKGEEEGPERKKKIRMKASKRNRILIH
jgi:hypothetical protein